MNKKSKSILNELGFPTTEIIDPKELISSKEGVENDIFVYLRYSTESKQLYGFSNSVLHKKSFIDQIDEYIYQLEKGYIVSIERKYTTLLGGATLYTGGYTYTEIVKGHSVSLLRRGLCGARVVVLNNGNLIIKKQFQRFLAEQHQNYQYYPTKGPTDDEIQIIVVELGKYTKAGVPGLLIEWMFTEESGFLCCDAKTGFTDFGTELYKLSSCKSIDVFVGKTGKTTYDTVVVGGFDCDFGASVVGPYAMLVVNDEALLSHSITSAVSGGNCHVVLTEKA